MGRGWLVVARAVTWPLVPLLLGAAGGIDVADPDRPRFGGSNVLLIATVAVAILAPYVVGVLLTVRVPRHGAGWAFLGLATGLAWSVFSDEYALSALEGGLGLPGGALMATFSDSSFVAWFVFLALCLHYTAAVGPNRRLRWLPTAVGMSAVVYQVCVLLRSTHLAAPYARIVSPWTVPVLSGPAAVVGAAAAVLVGVWLLTAIYELFSAFRLSEGETRQRLLWLVAGALPLGPAVVAAFAVSYAGYDWVAGPIVIACATTLALGAGLSVARYRLYDVERIVTDSSAYALSSGAVIAAFGLVVVVVTRAGPVAADSQLSTVLATLAGAGVARPAYGWARNGLDRRFNRRRFDAVATVKSELANGTPDVERVLRSALGDPSAALVFRAVEGWVTADGHRADVDRHGIDITRRDTVSARLQYDSARTEASVVQAVATAAGAEIDNLGLRAELARKVEQVSESRTRLATAHLDERRRMERDLHDGAQQNLLGIALQLQSARVNGDQAVLRAEIDRAIAELGTTVQDLRALANGLQPAALAGGGLHAATEQLAGRLPLRMDLDVTDRRYRTTIESAAWFVIAEGVSNVVKHADVDAVAVQVFQAEDQLHVIVIDHGSGGADPHGGGLQGLADRVAALGGRLTVGSGDHRYQGCPSEPGDLGQPCQPGQPGIPGQHGHLRGTRLEAVFPCG